MPQDLPLNEMREIAVKYLWKWIGLQYYYGGDDAMIGVDCSGLIVEVLQAVGILEGAHQNIRDWTAHGLYLKFKGLEPIAETPIAGCLVFWFNNGKAIHVGMLVSQDLFISAAGGNKKTKTIEEAIRQNAFVKLRPITYRGQSYKIVDPFLSIENNGGHQ